MSQSLTLPTPGTVLSVGALWRFNSHGFLPNAVKRLTVPASAIGETGGFSVKDRAEGITRFRGEFGPVLETPATDTDEEVVVGDFTALTERGEYWVELDSGERSPIVRIDPGVWNEPFRLAARAMYLWRCGCSVHAEWKGAR